MKTHNFKKAWESSYLLPLHAEHNFLATRHDLKRFFGISHNHSMIVGKGKSVETYYEEKDLEEQGLHGLQVFSDPKQCSRMLQQGKILNEKDLAEFSLLYDKDYSAMSNSQLLRCFLKAHRLTRQLFGIYYISQPPCFSIVEEKIISLIKGANPNLDARHAFTMLTSPSELSIMKKEQFDWIGLAMKTRQGQDKTQLIKEHCQKYRFLGSDEGNEVKTIAYYEKKLASLRNIPTSELEQERESLLADKKAIKAERKTILASMPKDKARLINDLTETIADFAILRFNTRFAWVPGEWAYRSIFNEVGKRYELETEDLESYLYKEIKALLLKGKKVSPKTIKARKESYVALQENDAISIITGKEAKKIISTIKVSCSNIKELYGMSASKGKVTGIVKVIPSDAKDLDAEMNKMKKGQVLVATQTKPQLMPAIGKASAIITNEGGICSHAAIVSREMNIPSIIGTGNATKVLKDGDMVEVDANNGIVRIIK